MIFGYTKEWLLQKVAGIFILALFLSSSAFASREPPREVQTQITLNLYYKFMEQILGICGRYPTTEEGLNAIFSRPPGMVCPSGSEKPWQYDWDRKDGWKVPIQYHSDGKTYRIDASHGYFLTERSPAHSHHHWDNPEGGVEWPTRGRYYFEIATLLIGIFGLFGRFAMARRGIVLDSLFLVLGAGSMVLCFLTMFMMSD